MALLRLCPAPCRWIEWPAKGRFSVAPTDGTALPSNLDGLLVEIAEPAKVVASGFPGPINLQPVGWNVLGRFIANLSHNVNAEAGTTCKPADLYSGHAGLVTVSCCQNAQNLYGLQRSANCKARVKTARPRRVANLPTSMQRILVHMVCCPLPPWVAM